MGGMQTFQVTLESSRSVLAYRRLQRSGGTLVLGDGKLDPKTDYNGVFADPAAFAKKVHVLWLGVGTEEPERMRTGICELQASLNEAASSTCTTNRPAPTMSGRPGAGI